jgi:hypothetical protein
VRSEGATLLVAASALPVTPKVGDVIEIETRERRVTAAAPTYSGEQVALWSLTLEA